MFLQTALLFSESQGPESGNSAFFDIRVVHLNATRMRRRGYTLYNRRVIEIEQAIFTPLEHIELRIFRLHFKEIRL